MILSSLGPNHPESIGPINPTSHHDTNSRIIIHGFYCVVRSQQDDRRILSYIHTAAVPAVSKLMVPSMFTREWRRHDHKEREGVRSTEAVVFDQSQLRMSNIYCNAITPSYPLPRALNFHCSNDHGIENMTTCRVSR